MKIKNPGSFLVLSYNINLGENAVWNTVGGSTITMDSNFTSHMV